MDFQLSGAISYNSVVELGDSLPESEDFNDMCMIAVGLKNHVIEIIAIAPSRGQYERVKQFSTAQKPTCLVQLSSRHLAVAVGAMHEPSSIEVHDWVS
jgi:hypothetical protein